mmetsp:Transcript_55894/g.121606  ORF Transcript_55894/g.121606 Transcript_55894/m.121606 type:complete len:213 (+) Transcript_55894:987-1625(+)
MFGPCLVTPYVHDNQRAVVVVRTNPDALVEYTVVRGCSHLQQESPVLEGEWSKHTVTFLVGPNGAQLTARAYFPDRAGESHLNFAVARYSGNDNNPRRNAWRGSVAIDALGALQLVASKNGVHVVRVPTILPDAPTADASTLDTLPPETTATTLPDLDTSPPDTTLIDSTAPDTTINVNPPPPEAFSSSTRLPSLVAMVAVLGTVLAWCMVG